MKPLHNVIFTGGSRFRAESYVRQACMVSKGSSGRQKVQRLLCLGEWQKEEWPKAAQQLDKRVQRLRVDLRRFAQAMVSSSIRLQATRLELLQSRRKKRVNGKFEKMFLSQKLLRHFTFSEEEPFSLLPSDARNFYISVTGRDLDF